MGAGRCKSNMAGVPASTYRQYVNTLRSYDEHTDPVKVQNHVTVQSTQKGRDSPQRDHFVEGQVIKSPQLRRSMAVLKQ